jgi:glycine/sarcosine N-methyltransferase
MGFYEQISKYYDIIFPIDPVQLSGMKHALGEPPKKVLDVACGAGGYSLEIARAGFDVTAVDLDAEMVSRAQQKAAKENLKMGVYQCDMKDLKRTLSMKNRQAGIEDEFDRVFCIGNSLVHLGSLQEIQGVLNQMAALLAKQGVLLLQIINFDRIIKNKISALPTLVDTAMGLEFIRKYRFQPATGKINFETVLTVEKDHMDERYENSVELSPVLSGDLKRMLESSGFREIMFYRDFQGTPYDENSFVLVAKALK